MATIMNMSTYAIEEDSSYADEMMYAGWNPQLELATQQSVETLVDNRATLPASLLNVDVEDFLQQMYAHQR